MKKRIILVFIAILLLPVLVFAESDYTINKLDTNIIINNNEITYKDQIVTNSQKNRINLQKKVNKLYYNGQKTAITDMIINDTDSNITTNTIEYTIGLRKKKNDIAIGNDYNASIDLLNFNIELNVNHYSIHFYLNGKDITNSDKLTYKIENNIVTGTYNGKLEENDDLILKLNDNTNQDKILSFTGLIIPLICLIISYFIWILYGKDLKNIKITKITIPEKNPLEVSYMYNGKNNLEDYVYMILYLANQGAISIKRIGKEYILIKNNKYETPNKQINMIIDNMFTVKEEITLSEFITRVNTKKAKNTNQLEINIKEYIKKIPQIDNENKKIIDEISLEQKYFEKVNIQRTIVVLLMTLTLLSITIIPFINLNKPQFLAIPTIFSIVILYAIINVLGKMKINTSIIQKVSTFLCIVFIAWMIIIHPMNYEDIINIIAFFIGIASTLIMAIIYKFMPKRTRYGTKELSKIEGLKRYLSTSDSTDLEVNIKDNKNYIYDLLPYTYIFGESDLLIEKARKIDVKKPKWLETEEDFNIEDIDKLINKIVKYVNKKQNQ